MKKHSYGKLISISWNWMVQILFRPFSLKKWIMLGIIVLLAGQMGGFNFKFRGDKADFDKLKDMLSQKKTPIATEVHASPGVPVTPEKTEEVIAPQDIPSRPDVTPQEIPFFKGLKTTAAVLTITIVVPIILFIVIFILLWMWVNSNFSFVFIDSIIRNDASLRVPFHRNKLQGNSYFRWNIVFALIGLLTFGVIISFPIVQLTKAGVFTAEPMIDTVEILSILSRYIPILLVTGILFCLIAFLASNFVLPIMYKRKIGILRAWGVFLNLLKKNIGEILLYLLVKIGLFILALIAVIVIAIIGMIVFLIITLLFILLGWLIYAITPQVAKVILLIVLLAIGIPAFMFLGFLFNLLFIPIPIFFRIFSIHVLGSIDESLDLFAPKTPEEIAAEGDDEKYRKSMRLVWFTVLSPILFVILLLLAIAIPNFQRARHRAFDAKQFDTKKMEVFRKTPSMQEISPLRDEDRESFVTVYLKNGNSFVAEIERESEQNIAFRIRGGTFILPRSDILRIER